MASKIKQSENAVTAAIVGYLQDCGWIADRIHVGVFYTRDGRPVSIGKPGQPDWRFKHRTLGYIEVEMKASGEKPGKRQMEYLATMWSLGITATWADSLEMFAAWYERYIVSRAA